MTSEENTAIVRRFIQEIFVEGRTESVDELVAEDFVPHTWPYTGDGRRDLRQAMERVADGLTDPQFTIEETIAEHDLVAVRVTASATQSGMFMGLPPSGKRYEIEEIHIFRIGGDGKVVEHWHQFDQMGLMQQLGAGRGKSGEADRSA